LPHEPLTQNRKLEAAARLKAIIESPGPFDPRNADAVAELLAPLPRSGPSFRWHREVDGERTEGALGSRETRCGAWLVERWGSWFDVRHIASAEAADGMQYRLRKVRGRWRLDRSYVRSWRVFNSTISSVRYAPWKQAQD
jgi:hypothetical protein